MSEGWSGEGLTRREALKRGALLGGALVWTAPIVQTVGMSRALAAHTSSCSPEISYIAVNLIHNSTNEVLEFTYFKFELQDGEYVFEEGFGQLADQCSDFPTGGTQGSEAEANDLIAFSEDSDEFCAKVIAQDTNWLIKDLAVFGGNCCDVYLNLSATEFTVCCPSDNCS